MSKTASSSARWGRRVLLGLGAFLLVIVLAYGVAFISTGHSQLARAIVWLDSDVDDIDRFPSRAIEASTASELPEAFDGATAAAFGRLDPALGATDDLESFLTDTESTALLVLRDGVLVHEWYAEGIDRETLQTSFSVSKSFLSTLIGIAIDDGSLGSLEDPITEYVPELLERDPRFSTITLMNLITMSAGLAYSEDKTLWGDGAKTYYSPDLRSTALTAVIEEEPGQTWLYNNYNPLLLGMVLERATGQSVTDYMGDVLWGPLGAGADASWSLDSDASGFEKMESGVNARAIDFARFGLMASHGGLVDGEQIVSQQWMEDATAVDITSNPDAHYQYFWHVYPTAENVIEIDPNRAPQGETKFDPQGAPLDRQLDEPLDDPLGDDGSAPFGDPDFLPLGDDLETVESRVADFSAEGNFGQMIYVAPNEDTVIVRLGRSYADTYWPGLLGALAHELGPVDALKVTP